jgi:hypothetical protein
MMQLIGLSKIDGVGSVAEVVAVDALLYSHMSFAGSSCQSGGDVKGATSSASSFSSSISASGV